MNMWYVVRTVYVPSLLNLQMGLSSPCKLINGMGFASIASSTSYNSSSSSTFQLTESLSMRSLSKRFGSKLFTIGFVNFLVPPLSHGSNQTWILLPSPNLHLNPSRTTIGNAQMLFQE